MILKFNYQCAFDIESAQKVDRKNFGLEHSLRKTRLCRFVHENSFKVEEATRKGGRFC